MTNLLNILNNLAVKILEDKKQLTLFALSKLSDSNKWNLLIVADWCESPSREYFKYLYASFNSELEKYKNQPGVNVEVLTGEILEFLDFPFIILSKDLELVQSLNRLYDDKPIHIKPVAININSSKIIEEIYLFATDNKTDRSQFQFLEYGRERVESLVS
jgi:hypothetical protein